MPKKRAPSLKKKLHQEKRRSEEQKARTARPKPWVAAVLNFLIWGTGYIYNRKRAGFGTLISIGFILSIASLLFMPELVLSDSGILYDAINVLAYLLMSVAFAMDAYKEAKK